MLIDFKEILAALPEKPKQILHVGAHLADEKAVYDEYSIPEVFWVEPNPELHKELEKIVGWIDCCDLAVSDKVRENVDFHLTYSKDRTNRGCSSLLQPTKILENPYLEQCGIIKVNTTTIDRLEELFGPFTFLNIDIEGAELTALKGATKLLKSGQLLGILCEFSLTSRYEGDCTLSQLDEYLALYKYKRVITKFATDQQNWGDFLAIKEEIK